MLAPEFLFDGPRNAPLTIALAHSAGAPMDSPFMNSFAEGLASAGHGVARFEFPYMRMRRDDGKRRPPNRTPVLIETWRAVIEALGGGSLVIGGKSMGGRMASMIADEAGAAGLVCLGYPFHGPGKQTTPARLAHLAALKTPTLIVQGARDRLGARAEVESYDLSPAIRIHWSGDGDHSLKPRVASGRTETQNINEAIETVVEFVGKI